MKKKLKKGAFVKQLQYFFEGIEFMGTGDETRFYCRNYSPYSTVDRRCFFHPDYYESPNNKCPKKESGRVCYGLVKRLYLPNYFKKEVLAEYEKAELISEQDRLLDKARNTKRKMK